MHAILLAVALFAPQAAATDVRVWQFAKIVRAEQPNLGTPNAHGLLEVWNPWYTHWYTFETESERIKATEMVLPALRRNGTRVEAPIQPPMAFKIDEEVKVAIQEPTNDPKRKRELYGLDSKGKEHILTIEDIAPKAQPSQ